MEEMGAKAFGSSRAAGIDGAVLYGIRCISNAAKWRSNTGSHWNEITANNEAG